MLLLMSGIAIGLLMMVNTEGKVGGGDLQNTVAYHNAEGGIEQMTSDLAAAFKAVQAPTANTICALSNNAPVIKGVTWKDYQVQPTSGCAGGLVGQYDQIMSGQNHGLWAQIIPVTLLATAAEPGNQEVSMMRTAQLALIPVFQFGVFSDSDLGFYSSPNLTFAGRVHTNGDLYLGVAGGQILTFKDKLSAYGNVIRTVLPNGLPASNYNDTGTVYVPTASPGCPTTSTACRSIGSSEGSVKGAGGNPPVSSPNPNWPTISTSYYNSMIVNGNYGITPPGGTGAAKLSLPFVNGTTTTGPFPFEIIRRPPTGESLTSSLGGSRLYNLAQIRILLSDNPSELPNGANDPDNVRLYNGVNTGVNYTKGVSVTGAPANTTTYWAEANTAALDTTGWSNCMTQNKLYPDWAVPGALHDPTLAASPTPGPQGAGTYNLIDGWLRVEYKDTAGNWNAVTREWLSLGFARGLTPPAAPGGNAVHPNAILLFQEPADRNGNGLLDAAQNSTGGCGAKFAVNRPAETPNDGTTGSPYYGSTANASSVTRNNWYPINFYDTREGNPRDKDTAACTVTGTMNAVELDVGNLQRWLSGAIPGSGQNVDYQVQNGYVLYFSDRRGMLNNPTLNPPAKTGDSGLEDSVNSSSSVGTPDGKLDPIPSGGTLSPEDVNQNGVLDNWGEADLGDGFGYNSAGNPYQTIACTTLNGGANNATTPARKAWVSGARHALKLVDGSLGSLPVRPDSPTCSNGAKTWTCKGGFTVASENPVYIQGNYNSRAGDTAWSNPPTDMAGYAAAGVIADAVTVLSNNWSDTRSFVVDPTLATNRPATTTYYRTAIAAGKSMNFPFPNWESATNYGTGTDGGVHNFLRFLEDWNGDTLNYEGSLVSLFYSTYNTGIFKCCTYSVYQPPVRNYIFDPDFAIPQGLPPGTPMFKDVNSLSYRQIYTQRTY
jgi:hypothetical protein